jgi:hypothetical protein
MCTAKTKTKSDSDFPTTDIDPQLMFQHLTTAANGLFENTAGVQMSIFPISFFSGTGSFFVLVTGKVSSCIALL